jgi:hypothetical protein
MGPGRRFPPTATTPAATTAPAHVAAVTVAGIAPSADALLAPKGTRARPPRLDTAALAAQP